VFADKGEKPYGRNNAHGKAPCRYDADATHPVVQLVQRQQLRVLEMPLCQLAEVQATLLSVAANVSVADASNQKSARRA